MPEDEFKQRLGAMIPCPVKIVLTRNRSSLITVRTRPDGSFVARVQHAFRAADKKTLKSLAGYISRPNKRSLKRIDLFLEEHHYLVEAMSRDPSEQPPEKARGRRHDLKKALIKVKREYGLHVPGIKICWSSRARKAGPRRSIKFGSFCHATKTIRVHPDLDREEVPEFFVEYIVYHEMLHAVFLPQKGATDRREVHTPEFKRFEEKFKYFKEALEFERAFMQRLTGRQCCPK